MKKTVIVYKTFEEAQEEISKFGITDAKQLIALRELGRSFITKIDDVFFILDELGVLEKKPTYKIGDRFSINGRQVFLLTQVKSNCVCLIDTVDGNRYRDFIKINDPLAITIEELESVGGRHVKLL